MSVVTVDDMSQAQRPLTEDEKYELAKLNAAVSEAIKTRRKWLDAKMQECSRLQVGDGIYDLSKGIKLGIVSDLYRYGSDRDEGVRDTSVHCDYQYRTYAHYFDNTSRQPGLSFGTREDAIRETEMRASQLRGV